MRTRNNNNGGGRMANMLRAMNAYVAHDSGGVEELAQAASEPRCADCGSAGVATITDEHGERVTLCTECHDYWQTNIAPLLQSDDAVTCHKCGAPVEPDALARQTMTDGSLMWPQPFCVACLVAGLKRLKAWLATGGAGMMGEDGDA